MRGAWGGRWRFNDGLVDILLVDVSVPDRLVSRGRMGGWVAWRRISGDSVRGGVFTTSMLDATKELGIQKQEISEAWSIRGLQHMIPIELQERTACVECSRTFRYHASILAAPQIGSVQPHDTVHNYSGGEFSLNAWSAPEMPCP